ncbi:hypothetical protein BD289DRAFT_43817 [Coniella lustricola]|uniref:Uncharacterized protein n=1 Tax=Coniella lustricola TaxID=2025994 RepID=A0A2T3A1R4_9PEZI|nr:hypothetical protein BD289DRAFT_43817 [Coniella lustricola]
MDCCCCCCCGCGCGCLKADKLATRKGGSFFCLVRKACSKFKVCVFERARISKQTSHRSNTRGLEQGTESKEGEEEEEKQETVVSALSVAAVLSVSCVLSRRDTFLNSSRLVCPERRPAINHDICLAPASQTASQPDKTRQTQAASLQWAVPAFLLISAPAVPPPPLSLSLQGKNGGGGATGGQGSLALICGKELGGGGYRQPGRCW